MSSAEMTGSLEIREHEVFRRRDRIRGTHRSFSQSRFLRGHIGLHTGPWIVRIDQISLGHRPQLRGRRHDIAGNSDAASMRIDELPKLRP